jgi:hypothetical protein
MGVKTIITSRNAMLDLMKLIWEDFMGETWSNGGTMLAMLRTKGPWRYPQVGSLFRI